MSLNVLFCLPVENPKIVSLTWKTKEARKLHLRSETREFSHISIKTWKKVAKYNYYYVDWLNDVSSSGVVYDIIYCHMFNLHVINKMAASMLGTSEHTTLTLTHLHYTNFPEQWSVITLI